jgi:hypothetical protein
MSGELICWGNVKNRNQNQGKNQTATSGILQQLLGTRYMN